ncbi:MAG: multidrug efflux SMR transporter [Planctomycetaceae bacterium]|nr:multidrug efflux SMR transporter [Planctomycetaceae bacterium]
MQWFYLVIAGLFEVAWAVCLKLSQSFSRPVASVATVILMIASFYFLSLALKSIPLGTAYAIWTGIGAAGVALIGVFVFHEPAQPLRIFFLLLVIAGVIGLKLSAS